MALLLPGAAGFARDIDLDAMYIDPSSRHYARLHEYKLSLYRDLGSLAIDGSVIHALWATGNEIIYIKEAGPVNIVYVYNIKNHRGREVARVGGTVTSALAGRNGQRLFLKQLLVSARGTPVSRRLIIDTASGKTAASPSSYPFMDFSLGPAGDALVYHGASGVVEYNVSTAGEALVMPLGRYSAMVNGGGVTIPYYSPNKQKLLIVSGESGEYRALVLLKGDRSLSLQGVTSSTEVCWLDNDSLMFRGGAMGDYSVRIITLSDSASRVLATGSLNTNIRFSAIARLATFLVNQVLHVYDPASGEVFNCGIEGEDASFSPDGSRCVTLLSGRLFVTPIRSVRTGGYVIKKQAGRIIAVYDEALRDRKAWNNDFTPQYIKKKLAVYRRL